MLKSIKVRLYPNKTQTKQFNELLGCCRFVYNNCLNKKIESYKNDKTSENLTSLGKYFHNELTAYLLHIIDTEEDIYVDNIVSLLKPFKTILSKIDTINDEN